MAKGQETKAINPPQQQSRRPGLQSKMNPRPRSSGNGHNGHNGAGKLRGKVALITGGDSGIGRAVAVAYAKEGADIAIIYLNEHDDAKETKRMVDRHGRRCLLIAGDIGYESFCKQAVQ